MATWMQLAIHGVEGIGLIGLAAVLYFFVVRPWRQGRQLSFEGLCILVFLTMVWQDVLWNYSGYWVTWNAEWVNLGAWGHQIPGSLAPPGDPYVVPILFIVPAYVGLALLSVTAATLMGKARRRWELGTVALVASCFAPFAVIDIVLEITLMIVGFYAFPGAVRGLSLFPGRYFQFPLYEAVIWPATWTAWACILYFRDRLALPRKRTELRFLALVGIFNVALFVCYGIPSQLAGRHADAWPEDIQRRSYFTNGVEEIVVRSASVPR